MKPQLKKLNKLRRALRKERTVAQLRDATRLNIHTIYKYLDLLKQTEIIKSRKIGNAYLYKLED